MAPENVLAACYGLRRLGLIQCLGFEILGTSRESVWGLRKKLTTDFCHLQANRGSYASPFDEKGP